MAVDLSDLIPSLTREVQPPGSDVFPSAVDDDWLGQLEDAFWEAKLFGFFAGYTESDGLVTPITGTTDLERQWQQLIVIFGGIRVVRMQLANLGTSIRAKAGPVEFEQSQSANVLSAILKQLNDRLGVLIVNLPGSLSATQDYYINSIFERQNSYVYGDEFWYGSSYAASGYPVVW